MAAVDSFHILYRAVAQTCHNNLEFLAVVGALYTARKSLCILSDCYRLLRLHLTPCLLRRRDFVQEYGEWAVVTGATNSLGKAYAEALAKRGMNVLLICSQREALHSVSEAIAVIYGVNTNFIDVDFSRGPEVYPSIKGALRNLDVGILVNNAAGFDERPEGVVAMPEDTVWEIIHVNMAAAVMMAHLVLPGMVERKRGAIVNVISGSDGKSDPQTAASKAYLETFSRKLDSEVSASGIFVQCLTPLHVGGTQHTSHYGTSHMFAPSPDVYARHAVRTLGFSTRTTGYWAHSLQVLACRWIPGWLCSSIGRFAQQ
ncbi:inactive hydroxysteroid dehydrogenase-like protein 1 [Bufo bufo]|uniref:inactive hydroxysteroid dehydrogenase-like protein 1 n=1 Tax=Bufo bufo TaxID=8384 RepID=UPI001ABDB9CC|nr:inactive hydroxysteroid dehydrogenase-like protein 1 [Bufo bufo]